MDLNYSPENFETESATYGKYVEIFTGLCVYFKATLRATTEKHRTELRGACGGTPVSYNFPTSQQRCTGQSFVGHVVTRPFHTIPNIYHIN
jgi:hypothetical protein